MDVIADWSNTLVYIGLFFVVKKALGLFRNIYAGWRAYVLPVLFKNENFTEKFGGWAVVTGCTGGIGREYALGLARKGMNLVLVSRSKQKLEDLEQEIVKTYKVKAMVIVADFTQIEVLDYIVTKLRESKVDIGVLVNNVGILGPHFQPFLEFDKKTVKDMIAVNISATTVLCHELLPDMVKRERGQSSTLPPQPAICQGLTLQSTLLPSTIYTLSLRLLLLRMRAPGLLFKRWILAMWPLK